MTFYIISIFPETFNSYFKESIIGRAIKNKKIKIKFYNPRDFSQDKHKRVDNKSYGGGPGMVMMAEPILKVVDFIKLRIKNQKIKIIILSPSGKKFINKYARNLTKKYQHTILICGRYEGIDARVKKILRAEDISIGDYVVTGGELPAMIIIDVVARQIKGVLGKEESIEENRVSISEVYTRPEILKYPLLQSGRRSRNYKVPKVLLSGDHKKIEDWKKWKS